MTFSPPPASSTQRLETTEALIASGGTDLERWRESANLAAQWDERASIAGRLIGTGAHRVLDVGAGAMALRGFLSPESSYFPADVAKRADDCLIIDLNRQEFPEGAYDFVAFLGVLEYIHDPAWPLRRALQTADHLIVSYCTDISGNLPYRRGLGWVNDFTKADFEKLLADCGWIAEEQVLYKRGATNWQFVWRCKAQHPENRPS